MQLRHSLVEVFELTVMVFQILDLLQVGLVYDFQLFTLTQKAYYFLPQPIHLLLKPFTTSSLLWLQLSDDLHLSL